MELNLSSRKVFETITFCVATAFSFWECFAAYSPD